MDLTPVANQYVLQDLLRSTVAFGLLPLFLLAPGYVLGWL